MIVPMKKFYLIVLDKDREKVPERLRKLGIAHIEELQGRGETYQSLQKEKAEGESVYYLLQGYVDKKAKNAGQASSVSAIKALVREVPELKDELDSLSERENQLVREIERVESWGEVSASVLARTFEGTGYTIRFFEILQKTIVGVPEDLEYVQVFAPKGRSRIAILCSKGEKAPELPSSFFEFVPSESSLSQMRQELASIGQKKEEIVENLSEEAGESSNLKAYINDLESDITLERLRSGMPEHERFAYLKGYVPARECEKFKKITVKYEWAIAFDDPSDEDQPPTLVENPPAVRIIQPVFDFLGTVPNYREYDISVWFLIFFAIFFAMIFGDASYGTIIVLFSLASIIAGKRKGRPVGDAQKLFLLLGGVTILWGTLTATWFAIPFDHLPKVLQNISLPMLNGQSPDSESNVKALCFLIGLIQLSIAHLKNIKRDFPDLKFLSQVGSLLLLAGMFNAALNLVIDAQRFPIGNWAVVCIAAGFTLVFVFGNWNGKLGSSILESLKGIIPTFLGTVSVFADIVSYIRLWAVGLAGLAFAQTINDMGTGLLSGPFGFLIGFILKLFGAAVMLVAGHSLNFVLTVLSVIVHGIRLNMLEFSGHLGMEWSGYKYDPLREDEHLSASMKSAI